MGYIKPYNSNVNFLFALIQNINWIKYINGSTIPHVYYRDYGEENFGIPTIAEQAAIGDFFQKLDHLITLEQKKADLLAKTKKSYLQKMFPQNGEDKPKIRFNGFDEQWEEKRLGEVASSFSGGTPSVGVAEYYGGEIPFIRSAEINIGKTELKLTKAGLKNSSAKIVKVGDILYALYGATSGEVGISKINGAINQAILAIKPNNEYSSQFIMQWLRLQKQQIINKYLQGGQGNLSGAIVKGLQINFPTIAEQTAIGDFFQKLDHLITLEQKKANLLKDMKKSLLQQMFV
jgi:type I restriction enzyme S subunit